MLSVTWQRGLRSLRLLCPAQSGTSPAQPSAVPVRYCAGFSLIAAGLSSPSAIRWVLRFVVARPSMAVSNPARLIYRAWFCNPLCPYHLLHPAIVSDNHCSAIASVIRVLIFNSRWQDKCFSSVECFIEVFRVSFRFSASWIQRFG
jgi:hypothetical protein